MRIEAWIRILLLVLPMTLSACITVTSSDQAESMIESASQKWLIEQDFLHDSAAQLRLLRQLEDAEPVEHQALLQQATTAYDASGSDAAKLRLALIMSAPQQVGSDFSAAKQLLKALQSAHSRLPAITLQLISLRLAQIDRITRQNERALTLAADNRALRKELEEARAKIKALTMIEQKLDTPATAGPTPTRRGP